MRRLGSLPRIVFTDRQQSGRSVRFGMPTLMWIMYLDALAVWIGTQSLNSHSIALIVLWVKSMIGVEAFTGRGGVAQEGAGNVIG